MRVTPVGRPAPAVVIVRLAYILSIPWQSLFRHCGIQSGEQNWIEPEH